MYLQEAYRRWVCSTLVPYFAEPQDVDAAPTQSASASTSGDDLASRMPTLKPAGKSKRAASGADGSSSGGSSSGGSKHKSQKLISNNNKSNNGNNMNEPQINQQPDQEAEQEREQDKAKQSVNTANVAQAFYNVVGMQTQSQSQSQFQAHNNNESRGAAVHEEVEEEVEEEEEEVEAQFNNFISTANKADPSAKDPVISKLQKR